MSISTIDNLITAIAGGRTEKVYKVAGTAEAAGEISDLMFVAGRPGAGTAPSVGLNGEEVTKATAGTIPFTNAAGTMTKYLMELVASATVACSLLLYDRLWQNSGIVVTTTGAQAITPVAIPSRDVNGAALGDGLEAWLEVYTATGNGSAVTTATISYTNTAGTAGRTGTITNIPATAVAGTICPIELQAGDTGIRSIQSITLGTSLVSGAVGLVIARTIGMLPLTNANVGANFGFDEVGNKLWPESALALAVLNSSTTRPAVHAAVMLGEA